MRHRGLGVVWIIIIILLILGILGFGAWWYWSFYMAPAESSSTPGAVSSTVKSGKIDPALVGTWDSGCLVPAQHNNWAEEHKIVFRKDGTATHTRLDWGNEQCSGKENGTITDDWTVVTQLPNKINLTWTAYNNTRLNEMGTVTIGNMKVSADQFKPGTVLYDIYQISGNTLKLGNGFRGDNTTNYDTLKTGASETDRFDTLNDFIIYKK